MSLLLNAEDGREYNEVILPQYQMPEACARTMTEMHWVDIATMESQTMGRKLSRQQKYHFQAVTFCRKYCHPCLKISMGLITALNDLYNECTYTLS